LIVLLQKACGEPWCFRGIMGGDPSCVDFAFGEVLKITFFWENFWIKKSVFWIAQDNP